MAHDSCAVCLEPLFHHVDGVLVPVGAATCGHCFHCACFWRWEAARARQDWRRASSRCPCPVCNAPVDEFIKLFIEGDRSEAKKLKKELKLVKCQLARERLRLEKTRHEFLLLNAAAERKPPLRQGSEMLYSSRRQLEADIQELVATAALLLNEQPPPPESSRKSGVCEPSHRRQEFSPLSSTSFPETRSGEHDYSPAIPPSASLPHTPRSRYCRNRRPEEPPSRTRRDEEVAMVSHNPYPYSPRQRPSPEASRIHSPSRANRRRPDPPIPPINQPVTEVSCHDDGFMSLSSLSGFHDISSSGGANNPAACPPKHHDGSSNSLVAAPVNTKVMNALRSPFANLNFIGLRMDPPPVRGLLGGCLYLD